jgi:hypothetical protein
MEPKAQETLILDKVDYALNKQNSEWGVVFLWKCYITKAASPSHFLSLTRPTLPVHTAAAGPWCCRTAESW